jgi:hypothetical protein
MYKREFVLTMSGKLLCNFKVELMIVIHLEPAKLKTNSFLGKRRYPFAKLFLKIMDLVFILLFHTIVLQHKWTSSSLNFIITSNRT